MKSIAKILLISFIGIIGINAFHFHDVEHHEGIYELVDEGDDCSLCDVDQLSKPNITKSNSITFYNFQDIPFLNKSFQIIIQEILFSSNRAPPRI